MAWRLGAKVLVRVVLVERTTLVPRVRLVARGATRVEEVVGVVTRGELAEERGATTVVLRPAGVRRKPDRCVLDDALFLRSQGATLPEDWDSLCGTACEEPGIEGREGAGGVGARIARSTGGVPPLLPPLLPELPLEPDEPPELEEPPEFDPLP